MDKILLGRIDNQFIYLYKHSFDCGWYWGFGYVGNRNTHFHIDSLIKGDTNVNAIFQQTNLSQSAWWIIRDLFIQAYSLKNAAATYRHGGHQTTLPGITDILKNENKAKQLNADLEIVLDTVWQFIYQELVIKEAA